MSSDKAWEALKVLHALALQDVRENPSEANQTMYEKVCELVRNFKPN